MERVSPNVDQAFQGLGGLVGLWRWVGERDRFAAQEIKVSVVTEKKRLWLRRVKLLPAHDEVGAKVVA